MSVSFVLAMLIMMIVISLAVSIYFYRRDREFGNVVSAVQTILSIGGLLVAAYWYFIERKGMPHANVHLSAKAARMSKDGMFLIARLDITNSGTGLLTIDNVDVRLLAANMSPETEKAIENLGVTDFPPTMTSGRTLYDEGELGWQGIRQYTTDREIKIEPGETDSVFVDFVIPCSYRLLKISGGVQKPGKEDLWYKDREILSTESICNADFTKSRENVISTGEK